MDFGAQSQYINVKVCNGFQFIVICVRIVIKIICKKNALHVYTNLTLSTNISFETNFTHLLLTIAVLQMKDKLTSLI